MLGYWLASMKDKGSLKDLNLADTAVDFYNVTNSIRLGPINTLTTLNLANNKFLPPSLTHSIFLCSLLSRMIVSWTHVSVSSPGWTSLLGMALGCCWRPPSASPPSVSLTARSRRLISPPFYPPWAVRDES